MVTRKKNKVTLTVMPPCLNTLAYLDATITNFLSHFSTPNSISNIPVREKKGDKKHVVAKY